MGGSWRAAIAVCSLMPSATGTPAHPLHRRLGGDDDEMDARAAQTRVEQRLLLGGWQAVEARQHDHGPLEAFEAPDRLEQDLRGLGRLVPDGLDCADALALPQRARAPRAHQHRDARGRDAVVLD